MIIASCNKCNSIDLNPVKLNGWNSNQGTFNKECIYCNTCCNLISIDNISHVNVDKNKLIKYVINQ